MFQEKASPSSILTFFKENKPKKINAKDLRSIARQVLESLMSSLIQAANTDTTTTTTNAIESLSTDIIEKEIEKHIEEFADFLRYVFSEPSSQLNCLLEVQNFSQKATKAVAKCLILNLFSSLYRQQICTKEAIRLWVDSQDQPETKPASLFALHMWMTNNGIEEEEEEEEEYEGEEETL
eukprot:TRINITY_DN2763_c0_g1_i1.p1 TRINITY_DN2763_c0_g1~~TRINITY_DN2763_c0_g1_i1.p1  ORF type:complete len:197 (+),score=70.51 TRINITY_DN2763_c0_g1_i1:53-592(+)